MISLKKSPGDIFTLNEIEQVQHNLVQNICSCVSTDIDSIMCRYVL